jgi:hypothetical protein
MFNTSINTESSENYRAIFKKYIQENQKVKSHDSTILIMTYKNVREKTGSQVSIEDIVNGITTRSERKEVKNKEQLPVAYFSASHISGRKEDKNVTQHSGLIICDIDCDDNPEIDFKKLKDNLCKDKYIFVCFNSPSGGIKVIIKTNIVKKEHHKAYFEIIKDYFQKTYQITKIDPTGCNIARACFLPYDCSCYFNPHSKRYCLNDDQITQCLANIIINKQVNSISNSLVQLGSISYDEHYENILNLLKKRTEVGLYKNIFNDYRFYHLEQGVMGTSVPFLEVIILKHSFPSELYWDTRIDEHYFKDNPQKQINIMKFGCTEGLEVCKIGFKKDYKIKEHFRAKTLGSFTMKLIYNNPFCHPDILVKEVRRINDYWCEDPHPLTNPKPDDEEVRQIVTLNYQKFLAGGLDFSTVIRRKGKTNEISKKIVFKSKQYLTIDRSITHLEAVRAFHEGKREQYLNKVNDAICALQNGKKITKTLIANYIGMSTRNLRRILKDNKGFDMLIKVYNKSLKSDG